MNATQFERIHEILDRLVTASNATLAFLIDENGLLLGSSGDASGLDTDALAALTARENSR